MDDVDWLADYRGRLAEIGARAAQAQQALTGIEATVTSPDAAVTASANPGGMLLRLEFSDRAEALPRTQLAATVVATAGAARLEAARRAVEAVEPVVGPASEAMRVLRAPLAPGGVAP